MFLFPDIEDNLFFLFLWVMIERNNNIIQSSCNYEPTIFDEKSINFNESFLCSPEKCYNTAFLKRKKSRMRLCRWNIVMAQILSKVKLSFRVDGILLLGFLMRSNKQNIWKEMQKYCY